MLQPRSSRLKSDIRALVLGSALMALPVATVLAQSTLPAVSVGAGVRTSFAHTETDTTPEKTEADDFELNSARLYVSGKVMDNLSIMFNTEYNTSGETIRVIDAAAQFSFADEVNIWVGRFLPPSDRANLYGPYYASHWGVYRDGIQDGYPFETEGRADGVMYWGQFGIAKVSAGVFDIAGLNKGSTDVMTAARVQLDFWDPEAGYYLNGTYYGDKDLLAVGVAAQNNAGSNAYSADFLFEKNLHGAGVVTVEAEYAKYDGLGGYPSPRTTIGGASIAYNSSDGFYLLGAYMLPMEVGIGKFQVLAKVSKAEYDFTALDTDVDQDTVEVNFNYIMKQFNARLSAFYIDVDYDSNIIPGVSLDGKTYGIGLQVQM